MGCWKQQPLVESNTSRTSPISAQFFSADAEVSINHQATSLVGLDRLLRGIALRGKEFRRGRILDIVKKQLPLHATQFLGQSIGRTFDAMHKQGRSWRSGRCRHRRGFLFSSIDNCWADGTGIHQRVDV